MRWMLFALCLLAANLGAQSGSWSQATSTAAWSDRWGHTTVSFNGSLWVLGGSGASNYNDVWSSTDGTTWTQATASAPWSARWYHTSVVFNNRIWVIGGYSTTYLNDVWSSVDGVSWTLETASAPWSARRGHASVVFNNRIWVMGGGPATSGPKPYLDDAWSSADGINWTLETNAPWANGLYRSSSVIFNNRMWLISGLGGADIWSSANGTSWTRDLSFVPWSYWLRGGVTSFDSQIWYVGGDDGSWDTNEVWTSSNGTSWTQRASASWAARSDHAIATFNSRIWVTGGYTVGTGARRDVWSFAYNDDSFEPDDTFAAAANVTTGTNINLRCYNPDWYRINVAAGQTLTVTINFIHNDGDLDMELYDATSTYVTGSGSTTNQEQVSTTASVGQEYRWVVYGYNGAANYQYSMTVSLSGGTGGILSWTPSSYDFGTITLGTDASRQFQLSCTGATVTGNISVTGSAYTIVSGGGAFSLSNGQIRNVTLRFTPSSVNTFFGTLSATGGGSPGASLVGDGVTSGGDGGGGGNDESCSTSGSSGVGLGLIAIVCIVLVLFRVAKAKGVRLFALLTVCLVTAACGSTATVRTAVNLSPPTGFPAEGRSDDTITLAARQTNTWTATEAGSSSWKAHRGMGGSINIHEAQDLFVVHNERNTPACWNVVWFTLPADREIECAELYLARAKKSGSLTPKLTVQDINLIAKRETGFFGNTTGHTRIESPKELIETVAGDALDKIGVDERATNPWGNDIPIQAFSDYDIIDVTDLVRASYERKDFEVVIGLGYTHNPDAETVGGFDSDTRRCVIMWARTGAAAPRLKLTFKSGEKRATVK